MKKFKIINTPLSRNIVNKLWMLIRMLDGLLVLVNKENTKMLSMKITIFNIMIPLLKEDLK